VGPSARHCLPTHTSCSVLNNVRKQAHMLSACSCPRSDHRRYVTADTNIHLVLCTRVTGPRGTHVSPPVVGMWQPRERPQTLHHCRRRRTPRPPRTPPPATPLACCMRQILRYVSEAMTHAQARVDVSTMFLALAHHGAPVQVERRAYQVCSGLFIRNFRSFARPSLYVP
jgi:hypothetical protein